MGSIGTGEIAVTESHKRYVRTETFFSIVLNMAVSALFVWIVFRGQSEIGLWGMNGLAFDLVPTTFMITLMTTIALTLITRKRVRNNKVAAITSPSLRGVPRFFLLRALLFAIVATAVLVPAMTGLLHLMQVTPVSYSWAMVFKLIYGGLLAVLITPLILIAALRD